MTATRPAHTSGVTNMLKYIESFDHIGAGLAGTDLALYTALGFTISGFGLSAGTGRFGTNSLLRNQYGNGNDGVFTPAVITRKCNKLIIGFSARGQICANISFRYGTHVNFSIVCLFNVAGTLTTQMCTGAAALGFYLQYSRDTNYPAIAAGPTIPLPYSGAGEDYHFVELYVDLTDYMNGRAKVAVDGRTYDERDGIITAAYLGFGSNPYDDRAKLDRVVFTVRSSQNLGNSGGPDPVYFDSIYLADDEGGYQDDFLGDVFVKTAYPVVDGTKRNWIPYANSSPLGEDYPHHELIDSDPIQPGDETEYLEADQDLTEEMVGFGTDPIPAGSELIAVNHRTMFRNVASPGSPKVNSLVPLFQMIGNPIVRTDSLSKKLTGWAYSFLDVYYDIVPVSAALWEEYLLEQAEFGFMLRTAENLQRVEEETQFADEAIVEGDGEDG